MEKNPFEQPHILANSSSTVTLMDEDSKAPLDLKKVKKTVLEVEISVSSYNFLIKISRSHLIREGKIQNSLIHRLLTANCLKNSWNHIFTL